MRIGGGSANRRALRTVPGRAVRPTSGQVRQALFNMLRGLVQDAIFVDLCAGTGSVGLEALSQGAREVYFVEPDCCAVRILQANISRCHMEGRTTIVAAPLPQALRQLPATVQADVLFLDPPYASDLAEVTLAALAERRILTAHGVLIWQHMARRVIPQMVLDLPLWKSRRYGNTQLSLYAALPAPPAMDGYEGQAQVQSPLPGGEGVQRRENVAERVVVAMSGGVDSSVSAALLHEQGYEVIGVTMKLWDGPETATARQKTCCTLDDVSDARRVAAALGMPFYVVNFKDHFRKHVIDYFVETYRQGATPNPCVQCNRYLKFTALMQRAQQLGARWVATGHYAAVWQDQAGRYYIRRGHDSTKDQSYFLFDLSQEQLQQTLLPLGAYRKEEVRQLAARLGLKVAEKPESQEICFIPEGDYRAFLRPRLTPAEAQPGRMVTADGETVGVHHGLPFYTVGQRRGLGVAAAEPLYVTRLDPEHNTVVVGPRPSALCTTFGVERLNWMCLPPTQTVQTTVQIRYRHHPVAADVHPVAPDRAQVVLQAPQFAVTPGQAAVFYDGDTVIGGGWIMRNKI